MYPKIMHFFLRRAWCHEQNFTLIAKNCNCNQQPHDRKKHKTEWIASFGPINANKLRIFVDAHNTHHNFSIQADKNCEIPNNPSEKNLIQNQNFGKFQFFWILDRKKCLWSMFRPQIELRKKIEKTEYLSTQKLWSSNFFSTCSYPLWLKFLSSSSGEVATNVNRPGANTYTCRGQKYFQKTMRFWNIEARFWRSRIEWVT